MMNKINKFVFALLLIIPLTTINAQYFDYDPDDSLQYAPLRKGEKAVIPLDTEDPAYTLWQTPRDDLLLMLHGPM